MPVVQGTFKKSSSKGDSRQKIELKLKVNKNGLITQDNFNNDVGSLNAIFPGNVVCELTGVSQSRKSFTYLLKAKERKGTVEVRVGTCLSGIGLPLTEIPVPTRGETVSIAFDADGDATTTTDIVDVGRITFK
ncbi:hypothetical protein MCAMS1_00123 [biofilm metagenome]